MMRQWEWREEDEFQGSLEGRQIFGDQLEVKIKEGEGQREFFWFGDLGGWVLMLLRLGILEKKYILGVMEIDSVGYVGIGVLLEIQMNIYMSFLSLQCSKGGLRWQEVRRCDWSFDYVSNFFGRVKLMKGKRTGLRMDF